MNRYKKELDHEKQITAIMCMVCPDHCLMRWKIEKLLRHGYPTEKIVKIVKRYCTSVNFRKCGGGDLVLEFAVTCSHCGVNRSITEEVENAPFGSYINMMDKAMELWNYRV